VLLRSGRSHHDTRTVICGAADPPEVTKRYPGTGLPSTIGLRSCRQDGLDGHRLRRAAQVGLRADVDR
jgi:hypothetical protein